ncbi:methyl-accepting chemotaxis protein [Bacillus sp. Bva_UNVM-123]
MTLLVVAVFVSLQIRSQIKESVISQTKTIVSEMDKSLQLFIDKYTLSTKYMAESKIVSKYIHADTSSNDEDGKENNELAIDFNNYLNTYDDVTSIYAASPKNLLIIPEVDLPAGFDPTSREWYKHAVENPNEVIWSEPYIDEATKKYVVTVSYAIKEGTAIIGVIGLDIKLTDITEMINDVDIGYNGFSYVLSKDGTAIVHPTMSSENLLNLPYIKAMYDNEKGTGVTEYKEDGEDKLLVYNTVPSTSWKIGSTYSYKDLLKSANEAGVKIIIISFVSLIIAVTIVYVVTSKMIKPIARLKHAVNEVATGDLREKVIIDSKDEIGDLGRHFNDMVDHMKSILSVMNASVENVKISAESLSAVSEETSATSEEMAAAINEIAKGASQSAAEAETANQLSTRLSSQINDVSRKAAELSSLAETANDKNHSGIKQMNHLKDSFANSVTFLRTMEEVIYDLENKISKIENVMTTITQISSQTNLLALNASIEAARAGEHGKGFAVVAEEVRKLAEQSVMATEEVKATINEIQNGALLAVESMNKTKENFDQQSDVVNETETNFRSISELVEQMKQSIFHIHREIDYIGESKEEVVQGIHSMASMAEEAAAACEEVSSSTDEQVNALHTVAHSAEQLTELSNELKEVIDKFKLS